jgi:hypothetical protein
MRSSIRFNHVPFSLLFSRGMHFNTPDGGEGAGAGAAAGGGGEKKDPPPNPDLIPRAEAQQAFTARDRAKAEKNAAVQLFAETLGIDPALVKIEDTGDKDKPFKLSAPGIEEIAGVVKEHRSKGGNATKWADRETELNTAHQRRIQETTELANKRVGARERYLEQLAKVEPIRGACAAEGALDDDGGKYEDLVALLAPRVRIEHKEDVDDQSKDITYVPKITVLNEDGTIMTDKTKGTPATVRDLVRDFLTKRPKFKKAGIRSGPGAGGYGADRLKTQTSTHNGNGDGRPLRGETPSGFMFGR